jgi:hypothetical protein
VERVVKSDGAWLRFTFINASRTDAAGLATWDYGPFGIGSAVAGVTSVNGSAGDVAITAGTNITISGGSGGPIVISATTTGVSTPSIRISGVSIVGDNLVFSREQDNYTNGILTSRTSLSATEIPLLSCDT